MTIKIIIKCDFCKKIIDNGNVWTVSYDSKSSSYMNLSMQFCTIEDMTEYLIKKKKQRKKLEDK